MIFDSYYWIDAVSLEKMNNHEIVVLEKNHNNVFTIRHAKNEKDWLYNQAAYINMFPQLDEHGRIISHDEIKTGELCRCLIISVNMK